MDGPVYRFFAGIDWATELHEVSVISADREALGSFRVANGVEGLCDLAKRLADYAGGDLDAIAVAIETPRGPVVETLVERGFHVYSINPKQLDRFRDRHAVAGSKDDRLDAFVLADSLRTDRPCFRRVKLSDEKMILLRELSRIDEDLAQSRNRFSNRLREQVMRFHPELMQLCPSADEPWFWELLELTGEPEAASRFTSKHAKALLGKHCIRRFKTMDIVKAARGPRVTVAPGTVTAAMRHIRVAVAQLRIVHAEGQKVRKEIGELIDSLAGGSEESEPRDAAILCSLPGVGKLVAATMLAEAPQAIAERDYAAFRAHAGIAPVTKRSGKRLSVMMRQACNERLRNSVYHWSRVSVQKDMISRLKYSSLRARGHSHGRALRSVADGLLRQLFGMLKSRSLYDPARRQATAAP
jgi:transposase